MQIGLLRPASAKAESTRSSHQESLLQRSHYRRSRLQLEVQLKIGRERKPLLLQGVPSNGPRIHNPQVGGSNPPSTTSQETSGLHLTPLENSHYGCRWSHFRRQPFFGDNL